MRVARRMFRSIVHGLAFALLGLAAATSAAAQANPAPDLVLTNGRIYTGAGADPWAQAIGLKGDRIVFVGRADQASALAGAARVVDLRGGFVMPGMFDAHIHPGMVAVMGPGHPIVDSVAPKGDQDGPLPTRTKAAFFAALREHARKRPDEQLVRLCCWNVEQFAPSGPDRRELDAIWPNTPVVIFDNSGHSYWANSTMLRLLGVTKATPDLTPVSFMTRDAHGEPTGWLKEFIATDKLAALWLLPDDKLRLRMKAYLDFLARNGDTAVFDGGNYGLEEHIYKAVADLDRAGQLPVRYFGSYHIWKPEQFDLAIPTLRRLQAAYGTSHVTINTAKIHYDGVENLGSACEPIPTAADPGRRRVIAPRARLTRFIRDLDDAGMDLHIHALTACASDEALDAIEDARKQLGRPLRIHVAICHLAHVDAANIARFRELDVTANFTSQWFGGAWGAGEGFRQPMGSILRTGANVSAGSDILYDSGISTTRPLIGVQQSMTRAPSPGGPVNQAAERLTLAEALFSYTLGGARQQGVGDQIGTLEAGKRADLVVLGADPFQADPFDVAKIPVRAVLMDGAVTAGSLD